MWIQCFVANFKKNSASDVGRYLNKELARLKYILEIEKCAERSCVDEEKLMFAV